MATPTKKETQKKFPTRTVVAAGYIRKVRGAANKIISIVLPDLEFKVCGGCGHWTRQGTQSGPNLRCPCCINGHKIPSSR